MHDKFMHFFVQFTNNITMFIVQIIAAILIILITLTLTVSVELNFNVLKNIGVLKIKVFKIITIFNSRVSVVDEYLNFSNKKSKIVKIKLDVNDKSVQYFNELSNYIKTKILPLKLIFIANICSENSSVSSLASSFLNVVVSFYYLTIANRRPDMLLQREINTGFRHNIVEFNLKFVFVVTLYDLLWSATRSALVLRRGNEKQKATKYWYRKHLKKFR